MKRKNIWKFPRKDKGVKRTRTVESRREREAQELKRAILEILLSL
jgi:hypothetical protein